MERTGQNAHPSQKNIEYMFRLKALFVLQLQFFTVTVTSTGDQHSRAQEGDWGKIKKLKINAIICHKPVHWSVNKYI